MVAPSPDASEGSVAAGSSPPTPPSPPAPDPFALPDRRAVLAASAPWLGALLNVLPGLGAGYLYQRRWRAWWITTLLGSIGIVLGGLSPTPPAEGSLPSVQLLSLGVLLLLALITAAEAFLAARRARMR